MILFKEQFSIRLNKSHNFLGQNGHLMWTVKKAGTTEGLLGGTNNVLFDLGLQIWI